jgi:anterior pharynx defective protein 1
MSGAFALINVLADSVGPGTVGLRGGGDSPVFFVTSALTTLCFILLHTCWSVTFFDALDRRNYPLMASVVISHFVASFLVR